MVNPEAQPERWRYAFSENEPLSADAVEEGFRIMESELVVTPQGTTRPSDDAQKIARWSIVFNGMTNGLFLATAGKAMMRLKFFPKPVEFDEIAYGSLDDRAERAWSKVRDLVGRLGSYATWFASDLDGDGAALWALNETGRDVVREMTEKNQHYVRKDFLAFYRVAKENGHALVKCRGIHESRNSGSGETTLASFGRDPWNCPPELVGVATDAHASMIGAPMKMLPMPHEVAFEEFRAQKAQQALPGGTQGDGDALVTDLAARLRARSMLPEKTTQRGKKPAS